MPLKAKLLIGLAAFVASQAAAAEPIYYDCDTPGGNYSEIKFNQSQSAHRVRGTITPMELRPSAGWLPTATVYVQSQDKRYFASLQLMKNGKTLDVAVSVGENGQVRKSSLGQIKNKDSISFDLYIPLSGDQAFAEVSGKRVPLGFSLGKNAKVSITCSSGHFRFDPLDWDWQQLP